MDENVAIKKAQKELERVRKLKVSVYNIMLIE